MPLYFFHVHDSSPHDDENGIDLVDDRAARREAIIAAGRMLAETEAEWEDDFMWFMRVVDDTGRTVGSLRFEAKSTR